MFTKIMLPVAAFAITATSVSAFNPTDILDEIDVDLTNSQIEILEEAHELRQAGEREAARTLIRESDIDRETLQEIRQAVKAERKSVREAIKTAVATDDYDAFLAAADGTKLGDVIDTQSEFDRLVEAYELKEAGDKEGARAIMDDLGLERPDRGERGERGDRPVRDAA